MAPQSECPQTIISETSRDLQHTQLLRLQDYDTASFEEKGEQNFQIPNKKRFQFHSEDKVGNPEHYNLEKGVGFGASFNKGAQKNLLISKKEPLLKPPGGPL